MSVDPLDSASEDVDREAPVFRSHSTYEAGHWETAHVDRVDQIGAFESHPLGDGPVKSREVMRVDLDGYGHGGASMHDTDDNVQVSVFLAPETARALRDDLDELLEDTDRLLEEAGVDQ